MDEIEKAAASLDHPQTWFSIYQYLSYLKLETPLPDYMEKVQNQLSPIMREHMVNRLVEVAEWYQLLPETLHLSISYIDRFLSSGAVPKNKLMILGVCCLFIASKYEEAITPFLEIICLQVNCGVSKEDALLLPFVYLCNYLGDLSLIDYSCLLFLPSMIAASVIFLARFMLCTDLHPWVSSDRTIRKQNPLGKCWELV